MHTDGAVAERPQLAGEAGNGSAGELPVGREAVDAQRFGGLAGEKGRLGSYGVGAPGRYAQRPLAEGVPGQGVEVGQQGVGQFRYPASRVEEGFALHHHQVWQLLAGRRLLGSVGEGRCLGTLGGRAQGQQAVVPEGGEEPQPVEVLLGGQGAGGQAPEAESEQRPRRGQQQAHQGKRMKNRSTTGFVALYQ